MERTNRSLSTLLLVLLVALIPLAATADPTIFYDPAPPAQDPTSTPAVPKGGVETVFLYLNPGTNPTSNGGALCDGGTALGGDGDETCGVHFEVQVSGDLQIVDFSAAVGANEYDISGGNQTLKVALLTTASPLLTGPTLIGSMQVDASGPLGGLGRLEMLHTVDADLEMQEGASRELFQVPEPGFLYLLLPGLAGLALVARRRARPGSS